MPAKKAVSTKAESIVPASKKASTKPKASSSKKIRADKAVEARTAAKPEIATKASEDATAALRPVARKSAGVMKPANNKDEEKINKSKSSYDSPESGKAKPGSAEGNPRGSEMKAGLSKPAESGMPAKAKTRMQDSALSGSAEQGPEKPGQKKRGWRDIEALTERARLKSLLSDIWDEDIDLDSDIFGETDHLFGYYTDKEEVVEVEPEEGEEWEEFEEEED